MAEEEKKQQQEKPKEEPKAPEPKEKKEPESLDEFWQQGVEAMEEGDKEEEPPPKEGLPEKKETEKQEEVKQDFSQFEGGEWPKTVKVQGEEVKVNSAEEAVNLMSKGLDYTKKTQALADERKKFEDEAKTKVTDIEKLAEKLNAKMPEGLEGRKEPQQQQEKPPTEQETKEKLYEKYSIDPDFADESQMKMVDEMAKMQGKQNETDGYVRMMMMKEAGKRLKSIVAEERKKYPFKDIVDKDGTNVTAQQYGRILKSKIDDSGNGKVPITKLARETVREIHRLQSMGSDQQPKPMTAESLKESNPKLYEEIYGLGKNHQATEDSSDTTPPSLTKRRKEAESTPTSSKDFKSLDDAMEQGLKQINFMEE